MAEDPEVADAGVNSEEPNTTKGSVLYDPTTDDAIPSMPEVQDHAIAAAKERLEGETQAKGPEPTTVRVKGKTDVDGLPYDPSVHEVPLRINKDGWIAKRRGGGPKNGKPTSPLRSKVVLDDKRAGGVVGSGAGGNSAAVDLSAQIDASADMACGLFFTGATLIGGEEFAPEDRSEQDAVRGAFKNYFAVKGCPDIPPGIALVGALGFFVAKRWSKPKFTEKRKGWWSWCKTTVLGFRRKNTDIPNN